MGCEGRPKGGESTASKKHVSGASIGEETGHGGRRENSVDLGRCRDARRGRWCLRCGHIPGHGGHVAVDGQGFCERIGSIEGAAAELDVELVLADAVDDPIETHVDRFAPLGANGLGSEAEEVRVASQAT